MAYHSIGTARKGAGIPLNFQADSGLHGACRHLKDLSRLYERIECTGRSAERRRAKRVRAAIGHALLVLRAGGAP